MPKVWRPIGSKNITPWKRRTYEKIGAHEEANIKQKAHEEANTKKSPL